MISRPILGHPAASVGDYAADSLADCFGGDEEEARVFLDLALDMERIVLSRKTLPIYIGNVISLQPEGDGDAEACLDGDAASGGGSEAPAPDCAFCRLVENRVTGGL